MKTIASLLLGFFLLFTGAETVLAASGCDTSPNQKSCRSERQKSHSKSPNDSRALRRQHTKQAYDQNNMTDYGNGNGPHFHKGKKMTQDERLRLRQQIDEAGHAIYHQ